MARSEPVDVVGAIDAASASDALGAIARRHHRPAREPVDASGRSRRPRARRGFRGGARRGLRAGLPPGARRGRTHRLAPADPRHACGSSVRHGRGRRVDRGAEGVGTTRRGERTPRRVGAHRRLMARRSSPPARSGGAHSGPGDDQQAPLHRRGAAESSRRAVVARRGDAVGPSPAAVVCDVVSLCERHSRARLLDRRRFVRLRARIRTASNSRSSTLSVMACRPS